MENAENKNSLSNSVIASYHVFQAKHTLIITLLYSKIIGLGIVSQVEQNTKAIIRLRTFHYR